MSATAGMRLSFAKAGQCADHGGDHQRLPDGQYRLGLSDKLSLSGAGSVDDRALPLWVSQKSLWYNFSTRSL